MSQNPQILKREFEKGKKVVLKSDWSTIWSMTHCLSARFAYEMKKVLVFDTSNSLDPHHPVYNNAYQSRFFSNIFCVRTPLPHDLWARLGTADRFIQRSRVRVLLITSLSRLFRDYGKKEQIRPLIKAIMQGIGILTKKHGLITVIGLSDSHDEMASHASEVISGMEKIEEVAI